LEFWFLKGGFSYFSNFDRRFSRNSFVPYDGSVFIPLKSDEAIRSISFVDGYEQEMDDLKKQLASKSISCRSNNEYRRLQVTIWRRRKSLNKRI